MYNLIMNKNNIFFSVASLVCFFIIVLAFENFYRSNTTTNLREKDLCESNRSNIQNHLFNDNYTGGYIEQRIDEIWYSKKYDSCFYSLVISTEFYATPSRDAIPKSTIYSINDYYGNIKVPEFNKSDYTELTIQKNKLR